MEEAAKRSMIREAMKAPYLARDEEHELALRWKDHRDQHALHRITVVMTDGTSYETRSTYGAAGDTLNLDIDPNTHPAWTGGQQNLLDRGGRLTKFKNRYAGLSI